jgi:hypothetical protein
MSNGGPWLPQPLAGSVRHELERLGGPGGGGIAEIAAAWPASVGSGIAANAWPARFARDGTLVVHASSSTWAYELAQLEEEIRARLGPLAPAHLRFVPGPIPEPAETVPTLRQSHLVLGPEEVRRGEELARGIEASGLRTAVARAAAASLAAAGRAPRPTASSDRLREA